ncbi:MAG: DUF2437 domain-containing protein [Comamonadaceae bacterium]|nr:MAG: DUF2437 domain-containing protein [Comamonadaceae bacterium]
MKLLRCAHEGQIWIGRLEGDQVFLQRGDLFGELQDTGVILAAEGLQWLPPCAPGKVIALWNNFHAAAERNGWAVPNNPLYFFKAPSSAVGHFGLIPIPTSYDGRVVYEGELAVIIGRRADAIAASEAHQYILGYSCANDVTAVETIGRDASFAQWARAKSRRGFTAFGPVIDTDFDPSGKGLRTLVNGRARQSYSFSDMFFGPHELVSRISQDMTLEAGDVIFCGTSLGAMPMKPGTRVEVLIEGLGNLTNIYGEVSDAG